MRRQQPTAEIRRVIVFDLDDTLFLERDYVESGFKAVGRWIEQHYAVRNFPAALSSHFASGLREKLFDAALCDFGIAPAASLVHQMVEIYRTHEPQITLADDATAFLANCRDGEALALITDGHLVAQRAKVRALGLERLNFRPIVCTDAWGVDYWKPHDRGFKTVQDAFALPAHAFTYVADNPLKDFIAPRRLGWRTIQIARPENVHRPVVVEPHCRADHNVTTLLNLDDLLDLPQVR